MVRSTTYDAGDPGSNPALGTQGIVTVWMLSPHYDAFRCSPMLTFPTKKLSTQAAQKDKERKTNSHFVRAEDEFPFLSAQLLALKISCQVAVLSPSVEVCLSSLSSLAPLNSRSNSTLPDQCTAIASGRLRSRPAACAR